MQSSVTYLVRWAGTVHVFIDADLLRQEFWYMLKNVPGVSSTDGGCIFCWLEGTGAASTAPLLLTLRLRCALTHPHRHTLGTITCSAVEGDHLPCPPHLPTPVLC